MRRSLSQESLKLIACVTMLLDHIGAVFLPGYYTYYALRILGRLSFPIYCFLLVEGAHHTRNPKRYAIRLALGALAAELPFDLAFYGGLTPSHQSVMLTMLLGLLALEVGKHLPSPARLLAAILCAGAAELLNTDYGAWGVVMIVAFDLVRQQRGALWKMALLLTLICLSMDSVRVAFLGNLPIELFAVAAMVPISLYSGKKATYGKGVSFLFYSFYPAHLMVLWLLHSIL